MKIKVKIPLFASSYKQGKLNRLDGVPTMSVTDDQHGRSTTAFHIRMTQQPTAVINLIRHERHVPNI